MGSVQRLLPTAPLPRDAGPVQRGAHLAIRSLVVRALVMLCLLAPLAGFAASPTPEEILRLMRSGRYAEAEAAGRALLAEAQRLHGTESLEAARALELLGEALRRGGKAGAKESREVLEHAVRIREERLGSQDSLTTRVLTSLGKLLLERGELRDAEDVLQHVLETRERTLGPRHPGVAEALTYLAMLRSQAGNDSAAFPLIERAIEIYRAALSADDPMLGQSLNVLASLLYSVGDFARAGPLYEQVLAIYLKAYGPEDPSVAMCHHNLGGVYSELGEEEESRRHLERALLLRRRTLGAQSPYVASTLVSLATTLEGMGDLTGARARFEEALPIQQRAYGTEHSVVAWTLMRLGQLDIRAGRYADGGRRLDRALEIQERALGDHHPDLSWTLSGLAAVQESRHDAAAARRSYERALAILERAYGPAHPDRIRLLNDEALFFGRTGDSALALDTALRSAAARAEQLRFVTRGLAERQALTYLSFGAAGLDLAVELAARGVAGADGIRRAWDAVIRSRTLVLDDVASRQKIAASATADSGLAATVRSVDAARRRYAGLLVRGAREGDAARFHAVLEHAREEMERTERGLAQSSLPFVAGEARARIGLDDILAAIPPDAALVSFAVCDTGTAGSYVAFIARPGSEPCAFTLGRAETIDPLIDRWIGEIARAPVADRGAGVRRAEVECRKLGEALRRKIWDPFAARLGPASRVFLVPDGALYRIAFAALPTGSSEYLLDSGPLLHLLTSERDLAPAVPAPAVGVGLLALGGPSFDRRDGRTGADGARALRGTAAARSRGPLPECPDFRAVRFEPLPGSVREVEEIARLWPDSSTALVLTGSRASEPDLAKFAPGRRVLHLATHGFFLDGAHCTVASGRRGIGGLATKLGHDLRPDAWRGTPARPLGSPLRLSGLAFAGANRRSEAPSGEEDGVLTAEEVASLDLAGAEWAVLSACETGVGRVQTGEGVLGLRRAFRVAGARTVIMSLWEVDDQATRRWMRGLYQARFRQGLETAEAVREAGRSVLRERRAQGLSTHPLFWAGFVAAGDWR